MISRNAIRQQLQHGFTLVELLIVVIILAILAAIVVPQFANTTQDANMSALDSNLSNVRSSLDLYAQQHNGSYPGSVASSGGTCGGTAGTGALNTEAALLDQLAFYTNSSGQACTTRSDGAANANAFPFGPYLKKRELPMNPITNIRLLVMVNAGNLSMTATDTDGWMYDNVTGKFIANDTANDPNGIAFSAH